MLIYMNSITSYKLPFSQLCMRECVNYNMELGHGFLSMEFALAVLPYMISLACVQSSCPFERLHDTAEEGIVKALY